MSDDPTRLDFSLHESDAVVVARGVRDDGGDVTWSEPAEVPFGDIGLSPAAAVLSYGLGVFEGLKVRRAADGRLLSFRVEAHAERLRRSAEALAMAPFPVENFHAAVDRLVRANASRVPGREGALYVRALQFADEGMLGLAPCRSFRAVFYCSPVGRFFGAREDGIRLRLLDRSRVAADSTGSAKAIGNYAGGLALRTEWRRRGFDDVLFVDARQFRCITETSGANVFFRFRDGSVATPRLDDQILAGTTRDSVLTLLREGGEDVAERDVEVGEILEDADECFCTGTAWTVQSVGELVAEAGTVRFPSRETRNRLREQLSGIQRGEREDRHGWIREITG